MTSSQKYTKTQSRFNIEIYNLYVVPKLKGRTGKSEVQKRKMSKTCQKYLVCLDFASVFAKKTVEFSLHALNKML